MVGKGIVTFGKEEGSDGMIELAGSSGIEIDVVLKLRK